MNAPVTLLRPYAPSKTLRAMARARHLEAVERLLAGDRETWWSMLQDVRRLDLEAIRARKWEERCRAAHRGASAVLSAAQRRLQAEALAKLLELAGVQ